MPTALERTGDFSRSHNASGAIVTILDPNNNKAPFPGNIVPQNRWNSYGAAILNFLPQPNASGSNNYNWISQVPARTPQFDEVYRADYNITDKLRVGFRAIRSHSTVVSPYGGNASQNLLDMEPLISPTGAWGVNINFTAIISPTFTNEFLYGNTRNYLPYNAPTGPYLRKNSTGLAIPLLYPTADPSQMIPNLAFGGVPSGTSGLSIANSSQGYTQFFGLPWVNVNPTTNFTDNVNQGYRKSRFESRRLLRTGHQNTESVRGRQRLAQF